MTEILQRGKLFYGYYNFNIYFFIIFGTNVVSIVVHWYMPITTLMFLSSKCYIHIIWANVVANSNALQVH